MRQARHAADGDDDTDRARTRMLARSFGRARAERVSIAHAVSRLAAALALPLALAAFASGCLDLDALRARAAEAPDAGDCDPLDVSALKLWRLHLGQSDYVTLKNTGECPIQLGGLRLFFDDHDEPRKEIDCLVQLMPRVLQAGAEVRVHEDPLKNDIGALENKLSGCDEDFPFNPQRGGVTYLCSGRCAEDSVLDVLAHDGEDVGPPGFQWGQRFDLPAGGVTIATQESAHYRRVRVEGAPPELLSSDWALERRALYADFEEAVEVELDGAVVSFLPEDGQNASVSASDVAAIGTVGLQLTHRGSSGRSQGLALELPMSLEKPTHVSVYLRVDRVPVAGAYFDLQSDMFSAVRASFEPSGLGTEVDNGKRTELIAQADRWYQVELRNLDWRAHTYDLYVDRVMIGRGVRFWTNAPHVDRLSLYAVTPGSTSYWDEIELWR